MASGGVYVADGAGRSERLGPLLKLPSIRPRATPCVDETVSEPDCAVNDSPVESLGVIPTSALVSVAGAGSPGMNLEPGLSVSVCSAASAASPLSNLMKRMYRPEELRSWLLTLNSDLVGRLCPFMLPLIV